MKKRSAASEVYLILMTVLMYLPILIVMAYSFNESKLSSVWSGFSLTWYADLFRDRDIGTALINSLILGVLSSLAAAVIGTLGAIGTQRTSFRGKGVMEYIATLPMMTPEIILGMLFLAFFSLLGLPFGMMTLVISHTAFCIPYVFMQVKARLAGMDKSYEEAARDLGAGPARVFLDITFPLIFPGILSGILLSFAMSFDDVIISVFVTGANVNTLPILIYTRLKTGLTPKINALCTLMFLATLLLVLFSSVLGRLGNHSKSENNSEKKGSKTMKKSLALILALVLCLSVSGMAAPAFADGETLTVYTWAEMFPPEVLNAFEAETGYKVNYVNFDLDETMLAKLEAANGGDYDVVIADDYIIERAIELGLLQKLDKEKISNFGNINPIYQGQFYDPTDEYTVPYGAGVQTIAYNPANVSIPVNGYADLWDEAFKDDIALTANYRVMIGMALKILGYSYNTNNLDEINEAGELLYKLAPNIRLIKDDFIQDDLVSGEVSAAVMYTSQVTMAKLADPSIEIVYPQEGIGFGIMGMFVPVNAPQPDAAHAFIDYILRPEVSAQCYEWLGYYCTNKASDDLISDEFKDFLVLPEKFNMEDMEMIGNISAEADSLMNEIWTQFKTLCGQE